ncbi:MAG TPA: AMP-binding protein [Candidatus Limnocylindrales bacterium]|nr:AMP-binding protein [Candidatus Limnocylindrales bacterium]
MTAAEPVAGATLLDHLERTFERYADRPALSARQEDGSTRTWTYGELDRRSRLAAWRLRTLGLQPGDRLLTWSPSTPELAAAYLGAIRARLILVPLDLRMSADAVRNIVAKAEPRHLVLGTGRDAPDPHAAGIGHLPTTTTDDLVADPEAAVPSDWETQVADWDRPRPDEVWDLIFTSGTTGTPKGVMIAHDNWLATMDAIHRTVPRLEHRILSLLPLSHLFEQGIGLLYALDVGAHILYVRSVNPRVIFEAFREHRVTSMIVVPQLLDVFWSAIEREVQKSGRAALFGRLRTIARRLPMPIRRLLFRRVHVQLGGEFRLFVSAGAFLPPALQQAWEDVGVTVLQGYGSSENGFGTCNTLRDHGPGTVGRPIPPTEMRIAEDGEVLFRGPTLFKGYWRDPEATARAIDPEGWYHTGDIGHLDAAGRLVLSGRTKDRIVLPNGFKVYPEDIENALRNAGIRESIVLESAPGRIEAVVLGASLDGVVRPGAPGAGAPATPSPTGEPVDPALRTRIDAAVRDANAALGPNQRIAGWRLWPDADFPRTHTLKVKRDLVRAWVAADTRSAG